MLVVGQRSRIWADDAGHFLDAAFRRIGAR